MTEYCGWCTYDMPESEPVVEGMLMHPECRVKYKRRERIDGELLPMLSHLGVNPYVDNLKYAIARLIEAQMDKGVEEGHSVDRSQNVT
jgi:hypothetical protein